MHHFNNFWVDGFSEDAPGSGDVVHQLVETCSLYFLALEIRHGVHEVEHDTALQQLVDEQILLLRRRRVYNQRRIAVVTQNLPHSKSQSVLGDQAKCSTHRLQ